MEESQGPTDTVVIREGLSTVGPCDEDSHCLRLQKGTVYKVIRREFRINGFDDHARRNGGV